ncbi:MAG TPA: glycoside hydrolase family 172 protein [Tepidisphaeraceae bacterium]|jgi:hypothetical protein
MTWQKVLRNKIQSRDKGHGGKAIREGKGNRFGTSFSLQTSSFILVFRAFVVQIFVLLATAFLAGCAQQQNFSPDMSTLTPGSTKAANALWGENPANLRFTTSKTVTVADLKGPGEITMIHFAYPNAFKLNRDVLLRIYWDGETSPSVDCPLVDFFCDPNGTRDVVNTAMVNVKRGFNAYFLMPFRKSAKVVLDYDGPVSPGNELAKMMPCYSYVCYRTLSSIPSDAGYFCASWKQEGVKLGLRDYIALETTGKGKLIGWNVTVRHPGRGYPVDENEKFYIDGEKEASVEFQGLEDSFGFSWGFPPQENMFPLTGWFPFMKGAAAYRFFLQDSISFNKSLKVAIGFGKHEGRGWYQSYSKFGSTLQFSTTCYWYQADPHVNLPPMPPAAQRQPAPEKLFWPEEMKAPSTANFKSRGVKLAIMCGDFEGEQIYHEPGYSFSWHGDSQRWNDWDSDIFYCRSDPKELSLQLNVPPRATGTLRLFITDPDNYQGGRKETISVAGKTIGTFDHFQKGRWIEVPIDSTTTADGKLPIHILNENSNANAVLSKVEWIEK